MFSRDTILDLREGMEGPRIAALCVAAAVALALGVAWFLHGGLTHADVVETLPDGDASGLVQQDSDGGVQPRVIYVHVAGAVNNPGVYELYEGDRVEDALTAAGGARDDADGDGLNRARVVADGERVYVATREEASAAESGDGTGGGATGGLVNLNTASAGELETLPGIGAATARKIVADRELNGPYGSLDDLGRVQGIGEKKLEAIRDLVAL